MRVIYDPKQQRVPIKAWLDDVDAGTMQQALNLANLPFAFHHIALLPDAHLGYGMPVGGVLPAKGYVVPNAVGVDIGCFTGGTKVPLLDGNSYTMAQLAARCERGEDVYVWACTSSGKIVAARATAQLTRRAAALVKVTLDNGETIRCTPDHQVMLRDGSYVEAQHLEPDTSLMPLYSERDKDGYMLIQQPYSGRWQKAHWIVARSGLLGDVDKFPGQRTVIHHVNFDEADNWPTNLSFMGNGDHATYHRSLVERNIHWQSSEFEQKRVAALAAKAATSDGRHYYAIRGTANILRYMAERPDHFKAAVAGNGQRGKQYLIAYNTSEQGRAKSKEIANRFYTCEVCGQQAKSGFGIHNHRRRVHKFNHKVVAVEALTEREDVYCLTVPQYHNFALQAGVFVHNCGMQARRTNVRAKSLTARDREHGTLLRAVLHEIQRAVPNGNGPVGNHKRPQTWDGAAANPEFAALLDRAPDNLKKALEQGAYQLGTLGGGNHFLEVQEDEDGMVWVMLHSGSRALGKH
ncbi:MAG: RtcB family protein, partial [Chloroflexota bacterium]